MLVCSIVRSVVCFEWAFVKMLAKLLWMFVRIGMSHQIGNAYQNPSHAVIPKIIRPNPNPTRTTNIPSFRLGSTISIKLH